MILIKLSEDNYEYDVQSLVRAFYHGMDIVVKHSFDEDDETEDSADIIISVEYKPDIIVISIYEKKDESEYGISFFGRVLTYQDEVKVDYSDRPDTKNKLKKLLYGCLSYRTQMELPWGTLTGIRPVKIPMQMLEEGDSVEEIRKHMHDTYGISEKKMNMTIELAMKELRIIEPIDYKNGYSLYIGIPFCPSTCAYCSFTSYPIGRYNQRVDDYIVALSKELQYISKKFSHKKLNTIYIGGGTPTTLLPYQLEKLFISIRENFDVSGLSEFTIEAGRPDSITEEKLQVILENGITRISINPQTMHDKTLKLIGRHHNVEQFRNAYSLARKMGFDNINTDLILGLPDEHFDDIKDSLNEIFKLNPENITVHSLAIKRAAKLNIFKEQYENCYFENDARIMDWVIEECRKHGYFPYYLYRQKNMTNNLENIGFAKEGKEGYYNILIMEEKQTIVGAGAGAITKFVFNDDKKIQKVDNVKDVDLYIDQIDKMIDRKDNFIKYHFSKDIDGLVVLEQLPDAIAHGICVSNLAYAIAKEYGLEESECYELAVAGVVHDIGKLLLLQYLNGSHGFAIEQQKYIRMHSKLSYDILKDKGFSDYVLKSILYHHENEDGTGFPDHLQQDEIPIGAKILRVCDTYIALISKRSYREAFDPQTAVRLMIDEAKNFDLKVFLAFQRVMHGIDISKITVNEEDIQ